MINVIRENQCIHQVACQLIGRTDWKILNGTAICYLIEKSSIRTSKLKKSSLNLTFKVIKNSPRHIDSHYNITNTFRSLIQDSIGDLLQNTWDFEFFRSLKWLIFRKVWLQRTSTCINWNKTKETILIISIRLCPNQIALSFNL